MAFESILVADDMLEDSQAALDQAVSLAKASRAKLTVVTVISVVSPAFGVPVPIGDSFAAIMEAAAKRLEALQQRLLSEGLRDVQTELIEGDPVDRVVAFADKVHPDLVVVGSRGLSATGRFFLGSVSDGILHHVHCSVLIVRGRSSPKPST